MKNLLQIIHNIGDMVGFILFCMMADIVLATSVSAGIAIILAIPIAAILGILIALGLV